MLIVKCIALDNVRYLRHRAPDEVRYGFMAGGGLLGLIYGIRRGMIRKLFYATIGTATAASIIYPKEAKGYALIAFCTAKKYATIGYNFVAGGRFSSDTFTSFSSDYFAHVFVHILCI